MFGLKPTYGRLTRVGTFPFVASLDHLGPLARSVADLALAYDAMLGRDAADPRRRPLPLSPRRQASRREFSRPADRHLGGYFARSADASAFAAVDAVARALNAERVVELSGADKARAAAYLITMVEGAAHCTFTAYRHGRPTSTRMCATG